MPNEDNNMRSVSQYRKDYTLTYKEVEQLTTATHRLESKQSARQLVKQTWKRLGKKYDFHWETVGPSQAQPENPKVISAIPRDADLSDNELHAMGISLESLEKEDTEMYWGKCTKCEFMTKWDKGERPDECPECGGDLIRGAKDEEE